MWPRAQESFASSTCTHHHAKQDMRAGDIEKTIARLHQLPGEFRTDGEESSSAAQTVILSNKKRTLILKPKIDYSGYSILRERPSSS